MAVNPKKEEQPRTPRRKNKKSEEWPKLVNLFVGNIQNRTSGHYITYPFLQVLESRICLYPLTVVVGKTGIFCYDLSPSQRQ